MQSVDLNCDMGESFGSWQMGQDELLMDYVSSINVACGFHAGDPGVMRRTVEAAVKKNLAIGAHPGYPDIQGFGRREIKMSPAEVYELVLYQIGALSAFVHAAGSKLSHVKPHGALYNTAARDSASAEAIASAVKAVSSELVLVGLSGSKLIEEARKAGLKTLNEVFGDRTYQDDGSLTPRTKSGSLIEHETTAAEQALQMVSRKTVTSTSGKEIPVQAETICIHGDGKHALDFARAIYSTLKKNHVEIRRPQ
jgi:5-oxoprolinase (ATP-hydrolysing) subunit A